jgi:hypothetical protein
MRRFACPGFKVWIAVGAFLAVAIACWYVWNQIRPGCSGVVIARSPSPDASWLASVVEYTCDVGTFSTIIVAEVHLSDTRIPTAPDVDILGVETGGAGHNRPMARWAAPDVLRVTMPLKSILKVLTTRVDGVRIDLHFDPDDPAARAAWLREVGLPPDQFEQGEPQR